MKKVLAKCLKSYPDEDDMRECVNGLDGWLKKIGRSIGKTFKQAGNQVKKIGRKSLKAVTKVTMKSLPVIHKALPIVNTAFV